MSLRNIYANRILSILLFLSFFFLLLSNPLLPLAAESTQVDMNESINKAVRWLAQGMNWGDDYIQQIITASNIVKTLKKYKGTEEIIAKASEWLNLQETDNVDLIARVLPCISEEKRKQLISKIVELQNSDGGWGITNEYESDILDTCLVLDSLIEIEGHDHEIQRGVSYLISAQNADGSWGFIENTEGRIYATALARMVLVKYKEIYHVDIADVLDKSAQWLLTQKNENGLWGDPDTTVYLSTFVYKALYKDRWEEVKNIPEKIALLQQPNGSWENDAYITTIALDVLQSYIDEQKVELRDVKILVNGRETKQVKAKEFVEVLPIYQGKDIEVEVAIINPEYEKIFIPKDSLGRYFWFSDVNEEGIYSAEVVLKNKNGEVIASLVKNFNVEPFIKIKSAFIEVIPGVARLYSRITPKLRINLDAEVNIKDEITVRANVYDYNHNIIFNKEMMSRLQNGLNQIEIGAFEPNTKNEGEYNITVTLYYKEKEIIKRYYKFKVLKQLSSVFTSDEDFDRGIMRGVNHEEVHDQLQLNKSAEVFPYIWIANAGEGTLSKIDTRTGQEIARYRTGPDSSTSPSRTAIDKEGNCWVANRGNGTVVKIALSGGIDKNKNGKIDTSYDVNNNGRIDSNEILPWGEDEAVLAVVQVGSSNSIPRAVAIDKEDRVWVGLYNERKFVVLNSDGTKTGIEINVPYGPYGATIDSNGILWAATLGSAIMKIDTNNNTYVKSYSVGGTTYGIVVDKKGIVWSPSFTSSGGIIRFDPVTEQYSIHYGDGSYGRGVAVDNEGNIWAAYSGNHVLNKFSPDGKFLMSVKLYPNGQGPIGVGVDGEGYVWAVNYSTSNAAKIKTDGTIVGFYPVGASPYTYSDMTGFHLKNITAHEGTWTVIHDEGEENCRWKSISWHEKKPAGTDITVSAKAANTLEELESKPYIQVQNNVEIKDLIGRFVQVEVKLKTSNLETPILEDISINSYNRAPIADAGDDITVQAGPDGKAKVLLDGTGSYDPDGDNLTYKWIWDGGQAEGNQPEIILPEGTTKIMLVVNDGKVESEPDFVNVTVVGTNSLKTDLFTDKYEYERGETVNISIYGENSSNLKTQWKLRVDILDRNKNLVANVVNDIPVELYEGEKKNILCKWETGTTLAGYYIVRATWKKENVIAAVNECNFVIRPDGEIYNRVVTDKVEYCAYEDVNITETIKNGSTNSIEKGLTVKTKIINLNGEEVWSKVTNIEEILQGETKTIKSSWNTSKSSLGDYTVVSEVYKGNEVIAKTTTMFRIIGSTYKGLRGELEVKPRVIRSTDDVIFDYVLTNTGNTEIGAITSQVKIINPVSMEMVDTLTENNINIGVGQSVYISNTWKHAPLKRGTYLVILDVVYDTEKVTLDSDYILVKGSEKLSSPAFGYTLFSSSSVNPLEIYVYEGCVNGDVHSNSNIQSAGTTLNINGTCSSVGVINTWFQTTNICNVLSNAPYVDIPNVVEEIRSKAQQSATTVNEMRIIDYGNGINIPGNVISESCIEVNGNDLTIGGYLISKNNISFNLRSVKSSCENGIVICSENGDINIHASEVELKGIIYAPNGTVYINVNKFKLTGRIYAKSIKITCSHFEATPTARDIEMLEP